MSRAVGEALESNKMSGNFDDSDEPRRLLSALADGEADAGDCARAGAIWASGDAVARSAWHSYHLIGDVLRSEALAVEPGRDEAFLQRLRLRLASEPAVLAPMPGSSPSIASSAQPPGRPAGESSRRWRSMTALAASVVGLGTVWAVWQWGLFAPTVTSATQLATLPPAATSQLVDVSLPLATFDAVAVGGKVVRDAQLDRYLRAHREYGAAAPASLPGGAARGIETVSLQR